MRERGREGEREGGVEGGRGWKGVRKRGREGESGEEREVKAFQRPIHTS